MWYNIAMRILLIFVLVLFSGVSKAAPLGVCGIRDGKFPLVFSGCDDSKPIKFEKPVIRVLISKRITNRKSLISYINELNKQIPIKFKVVGVGRPKHTFTGIYVDLYAKDDQVFSVGYADFKQFEDVGQEYFVYRCDAKIWGNMSNIQQKNRVIVHEMLHCSGVAHEDDADSIMNGSGIVEDAGISVETIDTLNELY